MQTVVLCWVRPVHPRDLAQLPGLLLPAPNLRQPYQRSCGQRSILAFTQSPLHLFRSQRSTYPTLATTSMELQSTELRSTEYYSLHSITPPPPIFRSQKQPTQWSYGLRSIIAFSEFLNHHSPCSVIKGAHIPSCNNRNEATVYGATDYLSRYSIINHPLPILSIYLFSCHSQRCYLCFLWPMEIHCTFSKVLWYC